IGFGPESEFAAGEGGIGEDRDNLFVIEETTDLGAFALDGERVPNTGGNRHFGTDDVAALAVDDFVKPKGFTDGTGANDVIVFFVLEAKSDSGHLLHFTFHGLEPGGEGEVI